MMEKTETKKPDPLEGYRGRRQEAYEAMEDEVRAFRSLADSDINLDLLQQIMRSDNILAELNNESSTLKRLVTFLLKVIDVSFKTWQLESDPTSDTAIAAHRNVAAARLVIDWIDVHMRAGDQAEQILNEMEIGEADERQDEGIQERGHE